MCVLGNDAYRLSTDGTNISGWHWLNLVTTSPAKVTGNYDLCVENHLKIVFISGRWIIVIQRDDSKKTWMPRLYVCIYIYVHCIYIYTVYIYTICMYYIYICRHRYTCYFHAFAKAPKPCQAYPVWLTSYAQSGSISNPGWWSHASFFERNLIFWYIYMFVLLNCLFRRTILGVSQNWQTENSWK